MNSLDWIDRKDYPFLSNFFQTSVGRLHYVDVGEGPPIIFVHGNPSWSYQFREVIKQVSKTHRCIAPDLIGFGLSDKPIDFSYRPQEQARHLAAFLDSLGLHDATLVVNDWGGPIGLSYAEEHPDRVSRIVITNTWMWSVRSDLYYRMFSCIMGGWIGRYLIRTRNLFAAKVIPAAFGVKSRLTPAIHQHYLRPLENSQERKGSWVFPKEIIASSEWLASLWERRDLLISKNVTIVWGQKDIAFRQKELDRWKHLFPDAKVIVLSDVGHYVSEEAPDVLAMELTDRV